MEDKLKKQKNNSKTENTDKPSSNRFFSEPDKLILLAATLIALFTSLANAVPWEKVVCYYQNTTTVQCDKGRQDLTNAAILFILTLLGTSALFERYKQFQKFDHELQTLKTVLDRVDLQKHITPIEGSKNWYKAAFKLIHDAENCVYDASLSSRTWSYDDEDVKEEKINFDNIRKKVFHNSKIETMYLTTIKTCFENNIPHLLEAPQNNQADEEFRKWITKDKKFKKWIKEIKPNDLEYELQIYCSKLLGDIERLEMIQENIHDYNNFFAAYLRDIELEHPLLSFLVVDQKKVLLGFYLSEFQESDVNKDYALLIDNKEIANMFTNYFQFLWEKASTRFAHGSGNLGILKDLLNQLSIQSIGLKKNQFDELPQKYLRFLNTTNIDEIFSK